jgi:hypothetical protein
MELMETAQELPQIAIGAAQMETLYGSIAGIVVGATLGGVVASKISFSGRVGNIAASSIQFLVGAGLYGYGLMGRVQRPALRSATQISGVVIAGMGLGRLLLEAGLPTFGLGAEESDASLVGHGDDGRVVGHAAEYDYAPATSSDGDDPTIDETGPVWTNTSLSGVEDPFKSHVDSGMMVPGSVDQWVGSAEQFSPAIGAVLGNHVQGSIGNGSVIGQ